MNVYDTLYGLATKAVDNYTDFFRSIAVAIETCRKSGKPAERESSLRELKRSCERFNDTLHDTICVCNENMSRNNIKD